MRNSAADISVAIGFLAEYGNFSKKSVSDEHNFKATFEATRAQSVRFLYQDAGEKKRKSADWAWPAAIVLKYRTEKGKK